MHSIILYPENQSQIHLFLSLAEQLGVQVKELATNRKETLQLKESDIFAPLQKIAQRNNVSRTIPNPVEWQHEIREDRELPNRN